MNSSTLPAGAAKQVAAPKGSTDKTPSSGIISNRQSPKSPMVIPPPEEAQFDFDTTDRDTLEHLLYDALTKDAEEIPGSKRKRKEDQDSEKESSTNAIKRARVDGYSPKINPPASSIKTPKTTETIVKPLKKRSSEQLVHDASKNQGWKPSSSKRKRQVELDTEKGDHTASPKRARIGDKPFNTDPVDSAIQNTDTKATTPKLTDSPGNAFNYLFEEDGLPEAPTSPPRRKDSTYASNPLSGADPASQRSNPSLSTDTHGDAFKYLFEDEDLPPPPPPTRPRSTVPPPTPTCPRFAVAAANPTYNRSEATASVRRLFGERSTYPTNSRFPTPAPALKHRRSAAAARQTHKSRALVSLLNHDAVRARTTYAIAGDPRVFIQNDYEVEEEESLEAQEEYALMLYINCHEDDKNPGRLSWDEAMGERQGGGV
ncbi:uncharacterized protein BDZ99DRAFT_515293 [Mytilinidion resinicola]|uniref:Uncharacterized protein n=1 Tax=Mytilinidion resinicola TaxID=574789 RepID=A0A6A6Z8U9_9PEZI|nr:uncharacterized protein BDZ99DRAFT_515293 [Mytilinidion resinicola]KAF2816715.1 hypothetical protein BDZ99DRAFT_515293 [Mytilinidion resinicola]